MRNLLAAILLAGPAAPAGAIQVEKLASLRGQALQGGGMEVVSGEALVRFSSGTPSGAHAAALSSMGAGVIAELAGLGWTRVRLPEGMPVSAAIPLLDRVPGVLEAAPNHAYRPKKIPNDPYFFTQYHLDRINAPQGWDDEDGSRNLVTIAVADSGVSGGHPDLAAKFVGVSRFCDPGANKGLPGDADDVACAAEPSGAAVAACNHATRVAGLAAGLTNNNSGVAGVSWAAKLVSLRIFRTQDCTTTCGDAAGQTCATDDTAIANAIDYARTTLAATPGVYGRVVLNMSIGEAIPCPVLIQTAATNAEAAGVTLIAAAGNGGGAVDAPGNCAKVIPVGATDSNDGLASFSSRGAELAANGVVAPGVKLVSLDSTGGVTQPSDPATGTSFSAPLVSGLAALLLAENNALTPAQVQAHIRNGADSLGLVANNQGAGRVNVCKSLKLAVGGAAAVCASGSSRLAGFAKSDPVTAFPNPFRTSDQSGVTIKLPVAFHGKSPDVKVFTMDGQLVRTIQAQATAAVWDAKNDKGNAVATGVYIVMVKSGSEVKTFKLALVR